MTYISHRQYSTNVKSNAGTISRPFDAFINGSITLDALSVTTWNRPILNPYFLDITRKSHKIL